MPSGLPRSHARLSKSAKTWHEAQAASPFDEVATGKTDVYSAARAILDRLLT